MEPYPEVLQYHCVWFGTLKQHHVLCLASLFATQHNPSVILWTDDASYANLKPLEVLFEGRKLEVRKGGPSIREHPGCKGVAFRSDAWRLQILHEHGGIYFDLDILFLQDISWFARQGIAMVQEGYAPHTWVFNNALMYFPKDHPGLLSWIRRMFDRPSLGWTEVFEDQSYRFLTEIQAVALPNKYSESGWGVGGPGWDAFFEEVGLTPDSLSGSLVYHWHNRWNKPVDTPGTLVAHYWNLLALGYWEKYLSISQ